MLKTFCRWLAPGLLSAIPLLAAAMGNPQPGLGVGLAAGSDGALYAARVRDGHVQILRSNDLGQHWQAHSQVNSQAEAIADDAENAPQLSVSAQGALYVSWSRRFAERFTGDIRFARAENGRDFSAPRTVHRDQRLTGHSFVRQHLDRNGRLWLVWIDGRERLDNPAYQGSALYASHSDDGGRQFVAEYKLVDHSCQCCRLALAERADGSLLLFWRQLFEQGQRDHALLPLGRERPGELRRATFDGWQVDACPHHGPALAEDSQGRLHALWFSPHGEQGPLFYGQLADGQVDLFQAGILLTRGRGNFLYQVGGLANRRHHLVEQLAGTFGQGHAFARHAANLLGGDLAAFGQLAHLRGHHREALAVFARTRRFDGRIERQQVGLIGDVVDDADLLGDLLHRSDRFVDRFASCARLLAAFRRHAVGDLGVLGVLLDR